MVNSSAVLCVVLCVVVEGGGGWMVAGRWQDRGRGRGGEASRCVSMECMYLVQANTREHVKREVKHS